MDGISKKTGLTITPSLFAKLHAMLVQTVEEQYGIYHNSLMDYQLYGFNQYEENLPSIKRLIFERTGRVINGKYLYNKQREYKKGKPLIKFNREYVLVYFQTLGFRDLKDFLETDDIPEEQKEKQLKISQRHLTAAEEEYYVGYYLGENDTIIASKLILNFEQLRVTWTLSYWEKENKSSLYNYNGYISQQESRLSLYFKNSDSDLNRSVFIAVYRDDRIKEKKFLRGGYSGYSFKDAPVVGEILFEKMATLDEMDKKLLEKEISPITKQYLTKKRIIVPPSMPQNLFELTPTSKYASVLNNVDRRLTGWLISRQNGIHYLEMELEHNSNKASLKIKGQPLYKGYLSMLEPGNLIMGEFKIINSMNPLFLSLTTTPSMLEKEIIGNLLGISNNDLSFNGKVYLTAGHTADSKLKNLRGVELTSSNLKLFPNFIKKDLEQQFKSNKLSFFQSKHHKPQRTLQHIKHTIGRYLILVEEAGNLASMELEVKKNGNAVLHHNFYTYRGSCMLSEGSIFVINIKTRNGIPHAGQMMFYLDLSYKKETFKQEGSWHYLDADLRPKTRLIKINTTKK